MRSAPLGELNGNDPSPGSTQAPNFTALLAARKFRNNVLSAEKRAEKAAFGAKLRAELPPGPLPDSTPPSTSKLLARLMSKDGMTPGDRLRKQEKLAAMQELLEKEKASPIEKAESKTSKTSASNTQTSSSKNIPEESPTTYFAHSVTPVETSGDTKYMGVDMDISENTTVTVPVVKRADEMVAADFTTPVPETKSAPRSPVSPDVSPEEEPHTSESSAEDAARRAHEQERVEAGALAAAQAAEEGGVDAAGEDAFKLVKIHHVARAISASFNSPVVETMRGLPQHQQMVLCAAVRLFRAAARKETTLGVLNDQYTKLCKEAKLRGLTVGEFSGVCTVLADQTLLKLGAGREDRQRKVSLGVHNDDVVFALQGVNFFRNLIGELNRGV